MSFGRYEAVGELGRGGMGVVLRGRSADGAFVAIKVLISSRASAVRERFEREMRLLGSLGEVEGFVPLLETGVSPRGPFIVMPLLEGGTLRDRLRRGPLPVPEVIELGVRLAKALGEAHVRGIVHRDLKPENVLYDRDGRAFVADLGLAKHFDDGTPGASQSVSLSRPGEVRGTAGYMAPEQMSDAMSVGPESDVFALGAILHECLTGSPAFEGATVFEVIDRMERGIVRPIAAARPEASRWLIRTVERCLVRAPEARYADGAALAAAIERREPGAARRPARGRILAAPILGALVLAAAVAAFAERGHAPSSTQAAPAPEAAPVDPEARLVARLRDGTCSPDELVAIASVATGAELLRKLGADTVALPLPLARAAAASLPRSHELAVLEAIAAIASSDDPRERLRAIERARRSSPEGLAVRLLDSSMAVLDIVAYAKARHDGDTKQKIPSDTLEKGLRPLAWRPDLVAWAVAPLASECRTAIVFKEMGADVIGTILRETPTLEGALDRVPPEVALAYVCFAGTWKGTPVLGEDLEQLEAMALELDRRIVAIEEADLLLAASAEAHAFGNTIFFEGADRPGSRYEERYVRTRRLIDRVLAGGNAIEADSRQAAKILVYIIEHRRAENYIAAACHVLPGETRVERFREALESCHAAVEVIGETRFALDPAPWHELVAILLALGETGEASGDSFRLHAGDPLFALVEGKSLEEVARNCRDILTEGPTGYLRASTLAIHARACRRLGRLDDALHDEGDPACSTDEALLAAAAFDGRFGPEGR